MPASSSRQLGEGQKYRRRPWLSWTTRNARLFQAIRAARSVAKGVFNKKSQEAEFYKSYFQAVSRWPEETDTVVKRAYDIAARFGLAALDALHVAAALSLGADELITTEKRSKPLYRTTGIVVRSIQTDSPR